MIDEEFDEAPHASWCNGTHNENDECIIQRNTDDDHAQMSVELNAVPTDHGYVYMEGHVYSLAGLDRLIADLHGLREALHTSCNEIG